MALSINSSICFILLNWSAGSLKDFPVFQSWRNALCLKLLIIESVKLGRIILSIC
ncbi:MAG: hypothetical protein QM629_08390 [Parafilimonas sp.]